MLLTLLPDAESNVIFASRQRPMTQRLMDNIILKLIESCSKRDCSRRPQGVLIENEFEVVSLTYGSFFYTNLRLKRGRCVSTSRTNFTHNAPSTLNRLNSVPFHFSFLASHLHAIRFSGKRNLS